MEIRLILQNKKFWIVTVSLVLVSIIFFIAYGSKNIDSEKERDFSHQQFIEDIYKSNSLMEISIFKSNSSNSKKSEMTQNAYTSVRDISTVDGDYSAVGAVVSFSMSRIVFIVYAVAFVWLFIETDRNKSSLLFALPRGRTYLVLQKILAIFICSISYFFMWFVGVGIASIIRYGADSSFFVPMQSVYELRESTFRLNIVSYLNLNLLLLVLGATITILLVWLIKRTFKSSIIAAIVTIIVYAAEYKALGLGEQSKYLVLKYINLWNLLSPNDVLKSYTVLEIGDFLVGSTRLFAIFVPIITIVVMILILILENRHLNTGSRRINFINFGHKFKDKIVSKINLFGLECWKILFEQKGIFAFIIIFVAIYMMTDTNSITYYGASDFKNAVYQQYSGNDLKNVRNYIDKEKSMIDDVKQDYKKAQKLYDAGEITVDELDSYSTKLGAIEVEGAAIESLDRQLRSLENSKKEGINVYFMDEKPFQTLWYANQNWSSADKNRRIYSLLATALVIFLAGFLFTYEKDMKLEKLINPLYGSRQRLFGTRHKMLMLICFIAWLLIYGFEIYEVITVYDVSYWYAPIQSVTFLADIPITIPIWAYLVIIEFFHFITLYMLGWIEIFICSKLGSIKGMLVSILIFMAPEIISIVTYKDLHWISLTQMVSVVRRITKYGIGIYICTLGILGFLALFCYTKVESAARLDDE